MFAFAADLHVGWPEPLDRLRQAIAARVSLGFPARKDADEGLCKADGRRQTFRWKRKDDALAHQDPADLD
jgi:hypothetical protein